MKASLPVALYSVRSERAFCEELEYNLLYRWFLDMDLMERSFDATVFTKNRQHLMDHDVGRALFDEVVWAADGEGLLSDEHFSVDGTLIEAAASLKSFRPRDESAPPVTDDDPGNPSVDFRGERRRNETHASTTDPEARLLRKGPGQEAKPAFLGHALMENRHGLLMDFTVSPATGTAERDAVPELPDRLRVRRPQGGHGPVREGKIPRKPARMGARRPAAAALEMGEVDALRLPQQQFHQVGEVGRLRFAAGCQGEYIVQQSHGTPLSMWLEAASTIAGPVRLPLVSAPAPSPQFTCPSCRWHRQVQKGRGKPAQNCPNHRCKTCYERQRRQDGHVTYRGTFLNFSTTKGQG